MIAVKPPRWWMLRFLLLCAVGCSRGGRAETERGELLYRADETIAIVIVNRSQMDATVYLVHDGVRDRLGAVTAATTASFTVRARLLGAGAFTLLADPLGSLRPTSTETLYLAQGTSFTWTLETDFTRGSVLVRE